MRQLSTWIVTVAFGAGQVLATPAAWALRPEVSSPAAKSGLEEALTPSPVARDRRLVNQLLGTWEIGADHHDHGDCAVWCHVGPSFAQGGLDPQTIIPLAAQDLEHRGYQSSGFITLAPGESPKKPITALGGAQSLKNSEREWGRHKTSTVQVVHLRWPTTGLATPLNAHPIPIEGEAGVVAPLSVSFNGDVTNFDKVDALLKSKYDEFLLNGVNDLNLLRPAGVGTDAWTIGALIYCYYRYETNHQRPEDLIKAVRRAVQQMTGYYAVTMTSADWPNLAIGFVKGDMPLYIGLGESNAEVKIGNFMSSEPGAFVNWARHSQKLVSGDIAVVHPDRVEIYAEQHKALVKVSEVTSRDVTQMLSEEKILPRSRKITELDPAEYFYELEPGYRYYTEQEIMFQPAAIAQTLYGYVPPSLYPDKLPYELTSEEKQFNRAFRDAVHDWMMTHRAAPDQSTVNTILTGLRASGDFRQVRIGTPRLDPEKIEKMMKAGDRVATLQRIFGHPEQAGEGEGRLAGVHWSRERIRGFDRIFVAASGTSGYAFGAWQTNVQHYTGLTTDLKDGTKYVDTIEALVRFTVDGLVAHGWDLDRSGLTTEDIAKYRTNQLGSENLVNVIGILRGQVLEDPRWSQLPEVSALRAAVEAAQRTAGIAVSQSGGTKDTLNAINVGRALGITFLSIVNRPGVTDIGDKTADDGGLFRTYGGTEKGVASTKAHTAQGTALELVALYLGLVRGTLSPRIAEERVNALREIPVQQRAVLTNPALQAQVRRLAEELRKLTATFYFGRGGNDRLEYVAKEGALKIKELNYILAEGGNLGEMKHGPIAWFPGTDDELLARYAVMLLTDRAVEEKAFLNLREIIGRGGRVICVCYEGDDRIASYLRGLYADGARELEEMREHLQRMERDSLTFEAYLQKSVNGDYGDTAKMAVDHLANTLRESGVGFEVHVHRVEEAQKRLEAALDRIIYIPPVPDYDAPLVAVLPLQLLALETTLATDRIATQMAEHALDLFFAIEHLEAAQAATASQKSRFEASLRALADFFDDRVRDGDLNMVEGAKLAQLGRLIRNVKSAPAFGEQVARARELVRAMAGREVSRLLFFRNLVAELLPQATAGSPEHYQLDTIHQELQQATQKASQISGASRPGTRSSDGSAYLNVTKADAAMLRLAYERLEPFISIIAEREKAGRATSGGRRYGRLVFRYNEWLKEVGLAEYLARNPDQPRGIAKIVTVEDRIEQAILQKLRELLPNAAVVQLWNVLEQGQQQLVTRVAPAAPGALKGEITEYRGVLPLLAAAQGVSVGDVRRQSLYHERVHFFLHQLDGPQALSLFAALARTVEEMDSRAYLQAERARVPYQPFRQQFEARYGAFSDTEGFLDEVVAKYYSAKFLGESVEFYGALGPVIEQQLNRFHPVVPDHVRLGADVTVPRTLHALLALGKISPTTAGQIQKLQQLVPVSTAMGLSPAITFQSPDEQLAREIATLGSRLAEVRLAQTPAGLALPDDERHFIAELMGHGLRVRVPAGEDSDALRNEVVRWLRLEGVGAPDGLSAYLRRVGIAVVGIPSALSARLQAGLEENAPGQPAATATAFPRLQVTMTEAGVPRHAVTSAAIAQPRLAVLAGKALNDALGLAAAFQWPSALPVVMVARDAEHQAVIEAGLASLPAAAKIEVLKFVHVAPGSAWNPDGLGYAAAAQRVADQLKTSGFASYQIRVFLNHSLWEISQFLGLPVGGASRRIFQQLEQQSDGIFA